MLLWPVKILLCYFIILTECQNKFRFDYSYNSGIDGWLKLHRIPAVWREARLRCKLEGAILASPIDIQMYAGLRSFLKGNSLGSRSYFTGINAKFSKGDYFSVEGVPLNKMPVEWLQHEPNNWNNEEDCIVMMTNGSLADISCNRVYPYVCYKKRTKDVVINGCGTSDREYSLEPRTGSCYKFHRVARTWSRAFMTCAAEGAHLAIANSQQEASVLSEIFNKNPPSTILQVNNNLMREIMHLGFHDWDEKADWTTIQGKTLVESGYNIWAKGQPDNATTGEFCGSMFRGGALNDVWCNEIGPFICEMVPDSLLQQENEGVIDFLREREQK